MEKIDLSHLDGLAEEPVLGLQHFLVHQFQLSMLKITNPDCGEATRLACYTNGGASL